MALFKILKGIKDNLPTNYNEGYCYVTTDEHKMYIDSTGERTGRFPLNSYRADIAEELDETAELITINDIDEICGQSLVAVSEVTF